MRKEFLHPNRDVYTLAWLPQTEAKEEPSREKGSPGARGHSIRAEKHLSAAGTKTHAHTNAHINTCIHRHTREVRPDTTCKSLNL